MSSIYKSVNNGGGVVDSVTGTNGITASPTTGNVIVSGINATTSTVGVASFNSAFFTVTAGQVSLLSSAYVSSATGANGISVSPTTGAIVIMGMNATTSTVGVASFNASNFTVNSAGEVSLIAIPFIQMPWTDESANFAVVVGNGYFVTATATGALPASPAQGNIVAFEVDSASAILTIQANAGQTIQIGKNVSASAGIAVSTNNGDSVILVYRASDASWRSISSQGTFTVT